MLHIGQEGWTLTVAAQTTALLPCDQCGDRGGQCRCSILLPSRSGFMNSRRIRISTQNFTVKHQNYTFRYRAATAPQLCSEGKSSFEANEKPAIPYFIFLLSVEGRSIIWVNRYTRTFSASLAASVVHCGRCRI